MTNVSHTPGPWILNGTLVHKQHDEKRDRFSIWVQDHNNVCDKGEIEANARLVSAAPDLLEACKAALDMIPSGFLECNGDKCRLQHCRSCYGDDAIEYDTSAIKAAIAKASPSIQ